MNLLDDIQRILDDPQAVVTDQWVEQAQREYPYCTLPLLLYLQRNGTADHDELLARLAIASPDRRSLAQALGATSGQLAGFYPPAEEAATPDTDTTIDRFLNSYGHTSDKEIAAINAAIFNPTPDYADVLAAQEGEPAAVTAGDEQDSLIDRFIAESREREREVAGAPSQQHVEQDEAAEIADAPVSDPVETDDSMLSESLAKVYIKRHKYAQALEIIENISLKYPEKSIYFADQIRFLKKLITLETLVNQQNK